MTINRRNFLKLIATALAGEVVGQTAPDGKLPPKWEKKFAALNLGELDKAILKALPLSNPSEVTCESFYNCMADPLWKNVNSWIKKEIVTLMEEQERVRGTQGRGGIALDSLIFWKSPKSNEFWVEPQVIKPEYVYGWIERPERTQDYITLPKQVYEQLKPDERLWGDALLRVVNYNIHTLMSVPYVVPTEKELMDGKVNAKIICTVGGLFPKRMEEDEKKYSRTEAFQVWQRTIPKINKVLENQGIPEETWDMFHKVGFIYVLSDFVGIGKIGNYEGTRCSSRLLVPQTIGGMEGVKVDICGNGTTPISRRFKGLDKAMLDKQKERRSGAVGNLRMALKDLEKENLSATQRRVLTAITAQVSAICPRMSKVVVAHQGTIMLQKNSLMLSRGE